MIFFSDRLLTDSIINEFVNAKIIDTYNNLANQAEKCIIEVISDSIINSLEKFNNVKKG